MNDAMREQLDMHELILVVIKAFGQRSAVLLLKMGVSFPGLAWHPIANDRVHGMISASAI